jgi:hypothetical protein
MKYTSISEGVLKNYLIVGLDDGTIMFLDPLSLESHAILQTEDHKSSIIHITFK